MIVKPKPRINPKALTAVTYRTPMPITERTFRRSGTGYYVCPRCHIPLEREFASYCDRCGQCLRWAGE